MKTLEQIDNEVAVYAVHENVRILGEVFRPFLFSKEPFGQRPPITILALDPSRDKPGYAIMRDGAPIGWGSWDHEDKSKNRQYKLMYMAEKVRKIINEYEPQLVFFEATRSSRNFTGVRATANAVGALLAGINFSISRPQALPISVSNVRKILNVNISGKPVDTIEDFFDVDLKGDEDAADALGVGVAAYALFDLIHDLSDFVGPKYDEARFSAAYHKYVSKGFRQEGAAGIISSKVLYADIDPKAASNLGNRLNTMRKKKKKSRETK